ncbi:beta-ketoacyl-[acyl-carrier-protein] synthase family protein [Streptomyces sp. TM32]|uniref:beta-ketoacyl-[acyl-carrier-protein] synthase family protein n=1 Tax=Streptomyces sp. TM32 TaxID=1652669 RepID=UPI00101232B2|nr:beta-ketoacyl synthase N-terminal-like domain-containing protein [Streptomyces sp. TM32]RXS70111.1 beta-ketoacyl-[acyl-carrier-protein] synthase family protein [Streptomyces sp. TM32]
MTAPRPTAERAAVVVTGMAVTTAFGRGTDRLRQALAAGQPAFTEVTRFDVGRRRAKRAAHLPGAPVLLDELGEVLTQAIGQAGLEAAAVARTPLLCARHSDPSWPRERQEDGHAAATGSALAARAGLRDAPRTYTNACVAASTALADAAALIAAGREERVAVAAGYLVDEDVFALFDAGRALADDGALRSFSAGRRGLLLGDGVAAVILESATAAERRGAEPLARLLGWGRAGDAHHVCQPHPEGRGMARALAAALARADRAPEEVDYLNAHGTGTPYNDSAEAAAVHLAFGAHAPKLPVSSTKSLTGHTLEASGLVEFAVSVLVLQEGLLPVNAGYTGQDPACRLDLVTQAPRRLQPATVVSLNAAFGGANTALVLGAA